MLKVYKLTTVCLFSLLILSLNLAAQQNLQDKLDAYTAKLITNIRDQSRPQAFLTADKSIYKTGESIWFNALLLNSVSQKVTTKSRYVFVDLVNDDDSVIVSALLDAAKQQLSSKLVIPDAIATGYYWLRAYTMQMISGDSNYSSVKPLYIFSSSADYDNKINHPKNTTANGDAKPLINFYPEGGNVITAANSKVAFSITDKTGKPIPVDGVVKDNRDSVVARLVAGENGLGQFEYEPARIRQYKAFIKWKGQEYSYPLPGFNFRAGRLSIVSNANSKRLVRVLLEDSIYSNNFLSYVIGIAKDSLCFASIGKGQYEFNIQDQKIPADVTTLYLLDSNFNLLSERSIYNRENTIAVNASIDKTNPGLNQAVAMNVSLTNNEKSNAALLDVRVTDSLYADLTETCTIPLAGYVNTGLFNNYFLSHLACLSDAELDMLMLFNKTDLYKNSKGVSQADNRSDSILDISGIALIDKDHPASNTVITLLSNSGNGLFATDTTDNSGKFYFAVDGYPDNTEFSLNTKPTAGKKQQVRFIINPLKWPVFKTPAAFKQHSIPEALLKKFKNSYLDTEPVATAKKLPVVQVKGKANYDESKRVSDHSAIITSDQIPEGGNVGNAILGVGGLHISQGFLLIGGPSSMRGPLAVDEPLILVNGAQAPLSAGSGIGEVSPDLSFLSTLNAREIDFIEVLKGTEAANYGLRGGNGVILINMSVNRKDVGHTPAGTTVFYARGIAGSPAFPEMNTTSKSSVSFAPADKRSTIFWEGGVLVKPSEAKTFNFSTNSIPANYKATISGVTSRGDVIYKSFTFKSK